MSASLNPRSALLPVLEFTVGGIVVLGGAALVYFSMDSTGMSLGIVHAILGLVAFPAEYLLLRGNAIARTLTLGVDGAIIAFSIASEVILSTTSSLRSRPFADSVIGTAMGSSHRRISCIPIDACAVSDPFRKAGFSSLRETESTGQYRGQRL
ncbi:MAG TPA: hypothetical protein VNA15_05495 [Candidatus Angelobacter sp.]|nr:hypothetical protein [Candidatus Angelobacter sp.]